MPDNKVVKGIAETNIRYIETGEVVQFERFGFCRLDVKKANKCTFYYTHK
jgi:hypothetical protein